MFFIVEQPNIRENSVAVSKTILYIGVLLSCCLHAVAYLLIVNVALQLPSPAVAAAGPMLSLQLSQTPNPAGKSAVTESVATTPSGLLANNRNPEQRPPSQQPQPSPVRHAPNARGSPVKRDPVDEGQDAGEKSGSLPTEEIRQQLTTAEDIRQQSAASTTETPSPLQDLQPTADTQTIATAVTSAMTGQVPLSTINENEASRLVSGAEQTPWPDYPAIARRRGWEGTALIGILVSGEGELMDVRLLASSGKAVLDDAAVSALRAWRLPSAADAEPQWFEVPVEFALR